ncbi:MAG: YihY/virulence factor BrkB family protein [Bacillota bacterium]|nr:YihY/virulence factor BrkB family protein [Bacillota bacterium]
MNSSIRFITVLARKYKADEVSIMSSMLAYSLLLSLMPFLIFLLTLVGFTSISSREVLEYLRGVIPKEALKLLEDAVVEVVDVKNGSLLSFSLVTAVWAATGGTKTVMRCLNRAYGQKESRGFIKVQLLSVIFTIGLVVALFITILLLVFGNVIGEYVVSRLSLPYDLKLNWDVIRYIVTVVVMVIIFVFIYRFLPSRRLKFREAIPGALFSTAGWITASIGFSFYVDNFGNYSMMYGGIAAVFILMAWIYLSSTILMLGGEINAALALDLKSPL